MEIVLFILQVSVSLVPTLAKVLGQIFQLTP